MKEVQWQFFFEKESSMAIFMSQTT